jgi:hypothetical protein
VTVVIGPAIDTVGLTPEQVMRRVEDWIEREMERLAPRDALVSPPGADASPSLAAGDAGASLRSASPLDKGA